jgi:hypothetical protein
MTMGSVMNAEINKHTDMATYRVVFEIEVEETTPLAAAQTVQEWLADPKKDWQFYVQDEQTGKLDSVDLSEPDEEAVLPAIDYTPLIKTP